MVWRLIIVLFVDVVNNVCTKELVVEDDSSIVDVVVDAHTGEVVVQVERRRQRSIIVLL